MRIQSIHFIAVTVLMSLAFTGCIENPGPDKDLGLEKRSVSTALFISNGNGIEFNLREDGGELRLSARNLGERIDSADFLVRLIWGPDPANGGLRYQFPGWEYHGRIRGLLPGDESDLGIVDSGFTYHLKDLVATSFLIRADMRGGPYLGRPESGVYRGSYRRSFPLHPDPPGEVRGFIDAQGAFQFTLPYQPVEHHLEGPVDAKGSLGAADSMAMLEWLSDGRLGNLVYPNGSVTREGSDSLELVFRLGSSPFRIGPEPDPEDTLYLRLGRIEGFGLSP